MFQPGRARHPLRTVCGSRIFSARRTGGSACRKLGHYWQRRTNVWQRV